MQLVKVVAKLWVVVAEFIFNMKQFNAIIAIINTFSAIFMFFIFVSTRIECFNLLFKFMQTFCLWNSWL